MSHDNDRPQRDTDDAAAPAPARQDMAAGRHSSLRSWARRHRRLVLGAVTVAGLLAVATAALAWAMHRLGPLPLASAEAVSVTVLDRNDRLLRAFTTSEGRWRLPVEVADVDQRYLAMLMAYEDRRFYSHPGFDPLALGRSVVQLAARGRIVSGGSTLTMQAARLLDGRHDRTAKGKLRQIVRALQLEAHLSKRDILRLYLRLAPFGGNIEGVRAASLAYFGKEPSRLSPAEAALLVALPQSPENRRPDRTPEAARLARDVVLARAAEAGVITRAEAEAAMRERLPTLRREFPKLAPHLAEAEVRHAPGTAVHRLTLDAGYQGALEKLASDHVKLLGGRLSAAILALDHRTGEMIGYVGSAGYLDETRAGAIDMVKAVRSPGSTLKPIIYGLAFEQGLAHPETLIEDRPVRFGVYTPKNFDTEFHGTVTIREALAQSLNIPAVKVLNAVGPLQLMGRFRRLKMLTALPAGTEPTLAIALGGIGMRLEDLATLYASLARGGAPVDIVHRRGRDARPPAMESARGPDRHLMAPVAAWYVSDILKDAPPPASARAGRIAYKTGTSYGYRDAWAIGYDGSHVIAVWVGRPDGSATPALTGRTAAAPILFDAFARIGEKRTPLAPPPAGITRVTGAELPPPLKRFREGNEDAAAQSAFLEPPVAISFPPDRSELDVEDNEGDPLVLKAEGGALPLTWLVDGQPILSDPKKREVGWMPPGRGFIKLSVIDAKGRVDRVTIRLK